MNQMHFEPRRMDIDNHADTIVAGMNCCVVYNTNMLCTVVTYHGQYAPIENVPIVTSATAIDTEHHGTIILEFGQSLDFTGSMDKTLVNPNQLRSYGIETCDDPIDPYRHLGIWISSDIFIPMQMYGSSCGLMSRRPTVEELNTCPRYIVSDPHHWDPSNVTFPSHVMEEEDFRPGYRTLASLNKHVIEPTNSVIRSVYDIAMSSISPCLATDEFKSHINQTVKISTGSMCISSMDSEQRHHTPSPESISQKWGCGIDTAKRTLEATTQDFVRSAILPLSRRYRTDLLQQDLRRLNITEYTDTVFAKCKSLTGNTCAQLFTDGKGFMHILPMTSKSEAGHMLDRHCQEVGIPNKLIYDGASEQVGKDTKFQRSIRHYQIDGREIEPFTPEQNAAEKSVRIIKSRWKWLMVRKRVPKRLWDMAMVWVAQIYSRTASVNDGRTGMERITGDTCDISEWVDFSFYDLCWYWGHPDDDSNPKIGRWLGVSHRVGSAMCYWVLTHNAKILSRTTVQHVTATEASKDEIQAQIRDYHCSLDNFLGNEAYVTDLDGFDAFINDDVPGEPNAMEDWRLPARGLEEPPLWDEVPDIDDIIDQTTPESAADTYHKYVGAEVCLSDASGERKMAKVIKRLKTGNNNSDARNPWMDTSTYEVEFPDGHVEELDANIIAENMYSLVDSEGRHHQVLSEIADHRKSHAAIPIENGFYRTQSGNRHPKKTTRGWDLLVEWKDGSSSWVPLKELKLSNPVELAEYAIANGIEHEPAFHWWVKHVLRRRDRIIAKVKTKYWRTTHKFGIRIPKTVEEALELDRTNGNDFWTKAIEKEMSKVRVAFEKLNVSVDEMRQGKFKPGYQEIKCHMIFDVKMDGNFTRKARLVAGGHMTEAPASITYSSVVSRDSVRIAFMLAALNDLDVFAADVGNAYLNAPCREKIWTVAGLEFGSDAGNVMLVVRALYGLKSSGAAWAAMLSQTLSELGYSPSRADRNVWLKRASKPDGFEYYEMILVYVDDILHISHDTKPAINALMKLYLIRKESMGPPNRYLGANIDKIQTEDGQVMWSTTCVDYCKGAIGNVEAMLQQDGMNPLKTYGDGKRPYPSTYRPEIDVTKELDDESTQRFQQWIGVLRWAIKLGRIDIMTEVSNLSCHLCMPREGHLDAVYRIFRYLQKNLTKNPGRIAFDPRMVNTQQECEDSGSHVHWEEFYPGAKEPIPPDMPEPLGNPVEVSAYVDANHAGNLLNRRSHTGILIYVNNAPIIWYSKRQNTVESSSFGSEFVALRVATEMIESLRYKLRMFGVPIIGPAVVYCDNKSVVTNASVPVSVLNKRHNAICYHKVREAQAAGTIKVMWIPGTSNLADLFTKTTLPGNVKNDIVETIFNN